MAARIPAFSLFSLILLALATVILGIMAWVWNTGIKTITEGGDGVSTTQTLPALQKWNRESRNEIRQKERELVDRQADLARLDMELAKHRVAYSHDGLLQGTALPGKRTKDAQPDPNALEAPIRGGAEKKKLKSSSRRLATDDIQLAVAQVKAHNQQVLSDEQQKYPKLDDTITQRRAQTEETLKQIAAAEAAWKADQLNLEKQEKELIASREKIEKTGANDRGVRASTVLEYQDRIRKLLELDLKYLNEILPCGNVLEVADRQDRVMIDLSSRDRIVPGMLFIVFSYDLGRFVEKGTVEVIKSGPDLSECKIVGQIDSRRRPIHKGDRIGNPLYSLDRPKTFVFAGEFSEYNVDDLANFVRAMGNKVVDKIGPGCDFLVVRGDAKDRADTDKMLAREYQVLAMTERQLLRFVRPAYLPK